MFGAPANGGQPAAPAQTPVEKQEADAAAKFEKQGGQALGENGQPAQQPQQQPAQGEQQPALIDGKFKSQDDLLAAYKALEAKLGSQQPSPKKDDQQPAQNQGGEQQPQPQTGEGIDFDAMAQEITANGDISAQSRALLKKAGIPDAMVQSHIDNVKTQVATLQGAIHEAAGGKEQFEAMRQWAMTALNDTERDFLGAQASQGPEQAKLAVGALRQRFEAVNGKLPSLVGGKPGSGLVGFRSAAEMTTAMKDPRYKTDPAYRKDVEQRIEHASF